VNFIGYWLAGPRSMYQGQSSSRGNFRGSSNVQARGAGRIMFRPRGSYQTRRPYRGGKSTGINNQSQQQIPNDSPNINNNVHMVGGCVSQYIDKWKEVTSYRFYPYQKRI